MTSTLNTKLVTVLDPGIKSPDQQPSINLGDLIIQESVYREIGQIFKDHEIKSISTHCRMRPEDFSKIRKSHFVFVGGTNLLSSHMNQYRQWKVLFREAIRMKKAVLFGVGWWQYQDKPDFYTRTMIRTLLSRTHIHSVRDNYTAEKLHSIGIKNAINTGCPTMWPMANIDPSRYPSTKADAVLLMLTDYNKSPEADGKLISLLRSRYKRVYVWPQGTGDLEYIKTFDFEFELVERSLSALLSFLSSNIDFDYIGTRLHGGILSMRHLRRSLIIAIDNRATEIANDTGLPITERNNIPFIEKWIDGSEPPRITLNTDNIVAWKSQFT